MRKGQSMKAFNYFQPTQIHFGCGRISEVGEIVGRYGQRCLLVTDQQLGCTPLIEKVKQNLREAGVAVTHFNGVISNPTTECITAGAKAAIAHQADVVLGLGGGSSMDSAKAIAVEATHEGTAWDYLFYKKPPTDKTLPIIAVSTTSGTGSQVTQVAVITNTANRDKSAIYNPMVYPKAAIVDPELMVTLPRAVTASTGFDVFCHAFESSLHPNRSAYIDLLAIEAIRLVKEDLPRALADGADLEARSGLAWADTLAGLCIANAGVTMPHGIGMAISGMYPHVAHGVSLAVTYPAFTRYTQAAAVEQFACMGRILNPALRRESDQAAGEQSCEEVDKFLKSVDLWVGLQDLKVPEDELPALAKQSMVLPDYQGNPRVVQSVEEMLAFLKDNYRR
jgi:alcohol dehydrogenase class IV